MASIEPEPKVKQDANYIGKCPICDESLKGNDIKDVLFRGNFYTHTAYVCRFCNHIIGFSAGRQV
jgi:hypothetical protein